MNCMTLARILILTYNITVENNISLLLILPVNCHSTMHKNIQNFDVKNELYFFFKNK